MTKAELDEYNVRKNLARSKKLQKVWTASLWLRMCCQKLHIRDRVSVGDEKSTDVQSKEESNNKRAKRLVWLDEFDLHFSHPACVRIVEKDIKRAAALAENEYYKQKFFDTAINYCSRAIAYCPLTPEHSYSRAVFYSNRAACYMSMTE